MRTSEAVTMAFASLRTNKLRSLLTLLGVIIGIAAVITILTLGAALKAQTMGELSGTGALDINVSVGQRPDQQLEGEHGVNNTGQGPVWYEDSAGPEPADQISPQMVTDLRNNFGRRLVGVTPGGMWGGDYGQMTVMPEDGYLGEDEDEFGTGGDDFAWFDQYVNLKPANEDSLTMSGKPLVAGRDIESTDIDQVRDVVIVSDKWVEKNVHGNNDEALGMEVVYSGYDEVILTIIGVYESPRSLLGFSQDEAFVPHSTYSELLGQFDVFREISVRPAAGEDVKQFSQELQDFFDTLYANNDTFYAKVSDFGQELQGFNKILTGISLVVSGIAGISLLVGGIGIMNIMLVTVTERTREIGIRKALGATRRDIRKQFVIEAMIICFIGGAIGVAIGGSAGIIIAKVMGVFVLPPLWGVIGSLLFSVGIGLFFGFYPANKAARLNPIEALRHE